jgi:hypothetical protein
MEHYKFVGNQPPRGASDLLGEAGTGDRATPRNPVFTVVKIWSRRDGGYIGDIIGRSIKPDETVDHHEVFECDDAGELIGALHRRDRITGRTYLPNVREQALWNAGEVDGTIDLALAELDEATETEAVLRNVEAADTRG